MWGKGKVRLRSCSRDYSCYLLVICTMRLRWDLNIAIDNWTMVVAIGVSLSEFAQAIEQLLPAKLKKVRNYRRLEPSRFSIVASA
jgi:hypothetical protein